MLVPRASVLHASVTESDSHYLAVPLDGPFLSHSPFQLNVPHSMNGNTTVGLQCVVPQGLTITPQEIPGASRPNETQAAFLRVGSWRPPVVPPWFPPVSISRP